MVRDGQQVTVRALTRMPGVADGEVRHLPWSPALAVLIDAGRYELLEVGGSVAPSDASVDESGDAPPDALPKGDAARAGQAVAEPPAPARPRAGRSR